MRWVKHDEFAIKSEDGRYAIAKIGGKDGHAFEVWRTRQHPEGPHLVAHNIAEASEARRLAAEDANDEARA